MNLLDNLLHTVEGHVQNLVQDDAWHYVRTTCDLNVNTLPTALVEDAHARMVSLYEELAQLPNATPFNITEEAVLRLAFVAARAAVTKTADPGELVACCARILAIGKDDIRALCLIIIDKALDSVASSMPGAAKHTASIETEPTQPIPYIHINPVANEPVKRAQSKKPEYMTVAQSQMEREKLLGLEHTSNGGSLIRQGNPPFRTAAIVASVAALCVAFYNSMAQVLGHVNLTTILISFDYPAVWGQFLARAAGASLLLPFLVTGVACCVKSKQGRRFRWGLLLALSLATLALGLTSAFIQTH